MSPTSSFLPSGVAPMITSRHCAASSIEGSLERPPLPRDPAPHRCRGRPFRHVPLYLLQELGGVARTEHPSDHISGHEGCCRLVEFVSIAERSPLVDSSHRRTEPGEKE